MQLKPGARTEQADASLGLLFPTLACSIVASEASTDGRAPYVIGSMFCAAACFAPRTRAIGLFMLALMQGARVMQAFPATANHAYLQLLLLLLSLVLSPLQPDDERQLLASGRIIAAGTLVWAGIQKILWGLYFDGRMLALLISKHERYQAMFGPFIGDAELARLTALDIHKTGSGPFLVDSIWVLLASNAVWILELGLGVGLVLAKRVQPLFAWLAAGLIVAIELGARETVFGLLMLTLLALFGSPAFMKRAFIALIAVQLIAAAIGADWLPGRAVFFIGDAL